MADRPILIWQFADAAERDGTGSDDGLVLGHVCYVVSTTTFYYASTVNPTTSSWTAVTAGAGANLAATLSLGNTTGGTDLIVSAGDALMMIENAAVPTAPAATQGVVWIKNDTPNTLWFTDDAGTDHQISGMGTGDVVGPASSTDNAITRFDSTTGKLLQNSVGILDDSGNLSGLANITLSGTVDGRDVAADGTALDAHIADVANPHVTTLALALASGATTGGTGIEISTSDPLTLNENATVPGGAPAVGKGKIWVRNDTPNVLVFTDDAGTDTVLGGTGVTPSLSQVLTAGNTTSGDDIDVSAGDDITFLNTTTVISDAATFTIANSHANGIVIDTSGGSGDITLSPGANNVILDYATFPTSDGSPNYFLQTNGAGTLSWASALTSASTLAQVLASGNTSGGTDVEVSAGDALLLVENASVPWTPVATKGAVWVKTASPNELWFTDDAGTDFQIAGSGYGDLADVLAIGNTTGGTDIVVSSGDKIITPNGSGGAGGQFWVDVGNGDAGFNGGQLWLYAGDGGSGGDGGNLILYAGSGSGSGDGADALMQGGNSGSSGSPGDSTIQGGQSTNAGTAGGLGRVIGGYGGSVAADGGQAQVTGGTPGTGGGHSGNVVISTPNGVGSGNRAGNISITCGSPVLGNATGASATLAAGPGLGTNAGGNASLTAGDGGATGNGGTVTITAGDGGATSGNGGNIVLAPGAVTSGNIGEIQMDCLEVRVDRIQHDYGTALVAGDFALSGGWGTTASVSSITGTDSRFILEWTSTGTGQAQNPTITLTFTDGAWPNAPFPIFIDNGSVDGSGGYFGPLFELTSISTTQAVWTLRSAAANGSSTAYTPQATDTWQAICHIMG